MPDVSIDSEEDSRDGFRGGFKDAEIDRLRAETPLVAAGRNHLNNAGASPPPRIVVETVENYLRFEAEHGGYEAAALRSQEIEAAYDAVAQLLATQRHNIAMVENASVAFATALSAYDWNPGDVILTTRNDYVTSQLNFLALSKRRGVEIAHAPDLEQGGVDVEAMARLIEQLKPKLVTLTWIPTNSGLVQPAAEVGALCRQFGVPFLLDACQAVGQLPIDPAALHCDYLAATGRKFLRGPRGTGLLYVADSILEQERYPLALDLRAAEWTGERDFRLEPGARRFENWEFNYGLIVGLGAAARYAQELGLERIARRSEGLAARARSLATDAGLEVLDRGDRLAAIVSVSTGTMAANEIVARLRAQGIHTSALTRDAALLDMTDKAADNALRISPHYFNTVEEVEIAVATLAEILPPRQNKP